MLSSVRYCLSQNFKDTQNDLNYLEFKNTSPLVFSFALSMSICSRQMSIIIKMSLKRYILFYDQNNV